MSQMLSIEGFAKLAGVNPRTVAIWLTRNQVPGAYKIGGRWKIPAGALEGMRKNPYAVEGAQRSS